MALNPTECGDAVWYQATMFDPFEFALRARAQGFVVHGASVLIPDDIQHVEKVLFLEPLYQSGWAATPQVRPFSLMIGVPPIHVSTKVDECPVHVENYAFNSQWGFPEVHGQL